MSKKSYNICVMRGDGIGPEIVDGALRVLDSAQTKFGLKIAYKDVPAGDSALKQFGDALPQESIDTFEKSDACLKGPVGESVMVTNTKLRFAFDLYANVRPAKSCPGISPPALRPDIDVTVIRENSEGFYRALECEVQPGIWISTGVFSEKGARRIAEFAFRYAEKKYQKTNRVSKLTLATKANIFTRTHGMYREVFGQVARDHRAVEFEHCYADALCARLVREPQNFDVVVSENLLADLLSDLVGQIAGGLGLTPGSNINYETKHAYFEPTHGSAPDIAGKHLANPIGQIRAASLMLEYLGTVNDDAKMNKAASSIELGIEKLLNSRNQSILPIEVGGSSDANAVAAAIASMIADNDTKP